MLLSWHQFFLAAVATLPGMSASSMARALESSQTAPVKRVEDARLAYALSAGQILSERTGPLASTIRLITVPDRGECDGSPETCPQVQLYIAILELEDPAAFSLFDLGKAFGWEATGWGQEMSLPQDACENRLYQPIALRKKVVSAKQGEWWGFEDLEVLVNPLCGRVRTSSENGKKE